MCAKNRPQFSTGLCAVITRLTYSVLSKNGQLFYELARPRNVDKVSQTNG